MMKINGFNGTNTQTGVMGMAQANDSVSKNIQNQIANAQQKLQDLSSNEELSLEDKMKKRQEIQQEITNLNQQLRQHQIEQRKEQQSKKSSMDDMVAGTKNTSAKKETSLSQAGMRAMISADSSIKQAKVQGSMATQMEGRAGVLESEIKQDAGKGNTEKKEEELADLQAKAQSATAAQMSSLSDANRSMEEASKADNSTDAAETKKDQTQKAGREEEQRKAPRQQKKIRCRLQTVPRNPFPREPRSHEGRKERDSSFGGQTVPQTRNRGRHRGFRFHQPRLKIRHRNDR